MEGFLWFSDTEEWLLFMLFFYAPTTVLFAVYLCTRRMDGKKDAAITKLIAWLGVVVLLACYGLFRCVADHNYGGTLIGYAVSTSSTTFLSGPLLIVASSKKWNPIWCGLLCAALPLVSFSIAELIMSELGQVRI